MQKILGNEISNAIMQKLKEEVLLLEERGITPTLGVMLVGDDPASMVYVNSIKRSGQKVGLLVKERVINGGPNLLERVKSVTKELNQEKGVHGIICQMPLPPEISAHEQAIIKEISPLKDVDCVHPYNQGLLAESPSFYPCTPLGVVELLRHSGIQLSGKRVVIVGRSKIVGRPLSIMLSSKGVDATVTLAHSKSNYLPEICREADILIAALGKPRFIKSEFIKEGAVVIDVGVHRIFDENLKKNVLVGDVDFENIEASGRALAVTPVPGGVGPMTMVMLIQNVIMAAKMQS